MSHALTAIQCLVREATLGTAVLIYGDLPPARLRLRPWFADRHLAHLVDAALAEGD